MALNSTLLVSVCDVIGLFSSDTIQTLPTWLDDDNSSEQLLENASLSESPLLPDDNKVPGIPSMGKKFYSTNTPKSKGKLASMRRRVHSPDCLRNPFLEDDAIVLQKLNSQGGKSSLLCARHKFDGTSSPCSLTLVHTIPKWCSRVFYLCS